MGGATGDHDGLKRTSKNSFGFQRRSFWPGVGPQGQREHHMTSRGLQTAKSKALLTMLASRVAGFPEDLADNLHTGPGAILMMHGMGVYVRPPAPWI